MAGRWSSTWHNDDVGFLRPTSVLAPDCTQAAEVDNLASPSSLHVGSLSNWDARARKSFPLPSDAQCAQLPVSTSEPSR